jgi:hypothetical protein
MEPTSFTVLCLGDVLNRVLEEEAKAHQAGFDRLGFNNVMDLARAKKSKSFYGRSPKRRFAKICWMYVVQFPTVFTAFEGKKFVHYPAVYAEDFFVSPEISAEFRNQTISADNPRGLGLGTYFERERIRIAAHNLYGDLPQGKAPAALIVEHGSENKAAVSLLGKLGLS